MDVKMKFQQMILHKMKQFNVVTKATDSIGWILWRAVLGCCIKLGISIDLMWFCNDHKDMHSDEENEGEDVSD